MNHVDSMAWSIAALDGVPERIALLNDAGVIVAVNASWRKGAEDMGLTLPNHGIGANYLEVCDATRGRDAAGAREMATGLRAILAGDRRSFQLDYTCKGANREQVFTARASATPGRGVLVTHQRSSGDWQRATAPADEVQRQLDEMRQQLVLNHDASSLMHDLHELNQPINAAQDFCHVLVQKLRERLPDDVELAQLAQDICGQVERAADIVRRTRANRGGTEATTSAGGSLAEVLEQTFEVGSHRRREENAVLSLSVGTDLPVVAIDSARLSRVLRNLERNALDSMDLAGTRERAITVACTETDGGDVVIALDDTGPGVPDEILERVFDPLFTTKERGMGMGLAICRAVVTACGGRLWAEPGPGGHFRLLLPSMGKDTRYR